jgi:hypothetical protein
MPWLYLMQTAISVNDLRPVFAKPALEIGCVDAFRTVCVALFQAELSRHSLRSFAATMTCLAGRPCARFQTTLSRRFEKRVMAISSQPIALQAINRQTMPSTMLYIDLSNQRPNSHLTKLRAKASHASGQTCSLKTWWSLATFENARENSMLLFFRS